MRAFDYSGGAAMIWFTAAVGSRVKVVVPVMGISAYSANVRANTQRGHCGCMFAINSWMHGMLHRGGADLSASAADGARAWQLRPWIFLRAVLIIAMTTVSANCGSLSYGAIFESNECPYSFRRACKTKERPAGVTRVP